METLHYFLGPDLHVAFGVILNLIIIESLLSVDNAAVLATMVMDLPEHQREKALKYGIFGAYFFRGLCLLFASFLIQITWLKAIGGLYLLYLVYDYFKGKMTPQTDDDLLDKNSNKLYMWTLGKLGVFWSTVALVEAMDLAFSIDNVFAAVAFTNNIWLILIGVFIGILAMRFVAQSFVKLMEKFKFLETIAFVVIALLGIKLVMSYVGSDLMKGSSFDLVINGHAADLYMSILTMGCFFIPVITSLLFNYPNRK